MIVTQEKLEEMYEESIKIWTEILGRRVEKKYTVGFNNKTRAYGTCNHRKREIQLSKYSLPAMPPEKAMNTMLHEVLHMIFQGDGHKGNWYRYANVFNQTEYARKYGRITRVTESSEELKAKKIEDARYIVKCTNTAICGREITRVKMSDLIKYPQNYRCGHCNAPFERIK